MHMKVQMRHFLIGAGARRVPDRQTVRRENRVDSARHFRHHDEDGPREPLVRNADISHVLTRHDEYVSRMVLAEIEERHRVVVASDHSGRRSTGNDLAKGAEISAGSRWVEEEWWQFE